MAILLNGIKFGIVLSILVGPVFFTIIQTSVEKGFWRGALVAFGISASDILIVSICYFGVIQFLTDAKFRTYIGYIGGGILILYGAYNLIFKVRRKEINAQAAEEGRGWFQYAIRGFLINGLSPSVIIFWVTTVSVTALGFGYSHGFQFLLFFGGVLATCLSTDLLKAYLAGKLAHVVTPKVIMIMNLILGIGMIVFGISLIWRANG